MSETKIEPQYFTMLEEELKRLHILATDCYQSDIYSRANKASDTASWARSRIQLIQDALLYPLTPTTITLHPPNIET